MYDYMGSQDAEKISRAHARWQIKLLAAKVLFCVSAAVGVIIAAIKFGG